MGRPKGSTNKPKIVNDGYANAFSGVGTKRDRASYTRSSMSSLLGQSEMIALYMSDGFARRVVDVPAEEMTRAGIEIENLEEEVQESVQAKLEELDLMKHCNTALRWSMSMGGALMVLGVNDGGALDVPLNDQGVKDVEFLRVYDRYQCTIVGRVTDPLSREYGKPEMWLISPNSGGTPYKVHASRVCVFDGEPVQDLIRQQNDGWGLSVYQSCYDQLIRLGTSHQWALALLERAQQAVHGIPNLSQNLRTPGGEDAIKKRVDVVDMVRGIMNTVIVDAEETYDIKGASFTGVTDIVDRFAEALSGVTGIPVYLLMGRSIGGLNSTGAANMDGWYARIEAMQNDRLRNHIDRIVNLVLRSMTGEDGGDYKLCFNSLKVESEKERAEVEKLEAEAERIEAETAAKYVEIGALDPLEVRKEIAEDYELDMNLQMVQPENADE